MYIRSTLAISTLGGNAPNLYEQKNNLNKYVCDCGRLRQLNVYCCACFGGGSGWRWRIQSLNR